MTIDGNKKKIRVNSSTTGQDLVNAFAEKIGLTETAFFQLSHFSDGADIWLQMREPVLLQGVTEHSNIHVSLGHNQS